MADDIVNLAAARERQRPDTPAQPPRFTDDPLLTLIGHVRDLATINEGLAGNLAAVERGTAANAAAIAKLASAVDGLARVTASALAEISRRLPQGAGRDTA